MHRGDSLTGAVQGRWGGLHGDAPYGGDRRTCTGQGRSVGLQGAGMAEVVNRSRLQRGLDAVERAGNKVPHPVIIFLALIALVIVLSHVFYLTGASVSFEQAAVSEQVDPSGEELIGEHA